MPEDVALGKLSLSELDEILKDKSDSRHADAKKLADKLLAVGYEGA